MVGEGEGEMMLLLIGVGIGLFIAGIIFWLVKDKVTLPW
jgi:nitrogen fixation-related uncharacterized protein